MSLTTNGSLLSKMAWSLKAAGLNRVNISLDSLDEKRFAKISHGGRLRSTLAGIKAAQEAGLTPIKLNTVLQRSTWKQEVRENSDIKRSVTTTSYLLQGDIWPRLRDGQAVAGRSGNRVTGFAPRAANQLLRWGLCANCRTMRGGPSCWPKAVESTSMIFPTRSELRHSQWEDQGTAQRRRMWNGSKFWRRSRRLAATKRKLPSNSETPRRHSSASSSLTEPVRFKGGSGVSFPDSERRQMG